MVRSVEYDTRISLWAVKAMAQLAEHIRDDAEQYWDLAYV